MQATHEQPYHCSWRDPSGGSDLHQGRGSGIGDAGAIHPTASGLRHAPPGRNAAIAMALHVSCYQACARLEARTDPEALHASEKARLEQAIDSGDQQMILHRVDPRHRPRGPFRDLAFTPQMHSAFKLDHAAFNLDLNRLGVDFGIAFKDRKSVV